MQELKLKEENTHFEALVVPTVARTRRTFGHLD